MTREELDAWVAFLHGVEQCGRHAPNCAWLGCTACCEQVAVAVVQAVAEGKLRIEERK
jgi:hypothetical protein